VVLSVDPVRGDEKPPERPGIGAIYLLLNPGAQADLKLDSEQVARASALAPRLQIRQNQLFLKLEGLVGDERTRKKSELSAVLDGEAGEAYADLLRPEQLERFTQIDLQRRGASAWLEPRLAQSLELTSEQSAKLVKILNQAMVRRREAQSNTRGNRRATTEKIEAIRVDTDAQAVALLTSSQVEIWKKLIGEPFTYQDHR